MLPEAVVALGRMLLGRHRFSVCSDDVVFQPGVYVIKDGPFLIAANAEVSGTGVGFYFVGDAGQATVFSAGPQSFIDFSAPIDGPLAGILFFEDRGAPPLRTFEILSDKARNLLGTFYIPNGQFSVRSGKPLNIQVYYDKK